MNNRRNPNQQSWGNFFAVLFIVGLFAAIALIPSKVMESSLQAEINAITQVGSEQTKAWISAKAAAFIEPTVESAKKQIAELGSSQIENWLADRIYATTLWIGIIAYRVQTMTMWFLVGLPLLLAATVDGYYVREIRKSAFTSQSPIRHKIGVHFFRLVTIALLIWLLLPIYVPPFVAPFAIIFAAVSMWLWVANLQKRV